MSDEIQVSLYGSGINQKVFMKPKRFKSGKTGWYLQLKGVDVGGKKYVLNFMLYEEKA